MLFGKKKKVDRQEYCELCSKPVSLALRCRLSDGHIICEDCFLGAGFGMITNPKNVSMEDVLKRVGKPGADGAEAADAGAENKNK